MMLWYKSWLDTRWRFLTGLALLTCSAAFVVFTYPRVAELLPLMPSVGGSGELARRIREAAELARDYRGYLWSQWFRQNPVQMGTLFAVLLGSGGLVSQGSSGALFTLSLPATRTRLVGVRAAAGLLEWLVLALASSLTISLVSPSVGETFSVWAALGHAICLFAAGAVFFALALLLSTIFVDVWRPLLIAISAAIVLGIVETLSRQAGVSGIFAVMNGESVFRTGHLPWIGLALCTAATASMLYGATLSFARRDF
jgi:hypothetical protein